VVRLGPPDLSRFNRPRWVMLRSLVLPGWGQVHNHAWLKAGAVAGTQAWLITSLIHDKRTLDDLKREVDAAGAAGDDLLQQDLVDRYNTRLSSYQSRQWLLGGVVVFALLDAYIDAHFRNFKIEFESDPALPSGASTGGDLRIGVEWKY
jgi:hypothetical protein